MQMHKIPSLFCVMAAATLVSCQSGTNGNSTVLNQPLNTSLKYVVDVSDSAGTFKYETNQNFRPLSKNVAELSADERGLFEAVNAERAKGGECTDPRGVVYKNPPTKPLLLESRIYNAAVKYAEAMVKGNFHGHIHPTDENYKTPARRMTKEGYTPIAPLQGSEMSLFFEENLAYGYYEHHEVIEAWKKESFAHCMTIYEPLSYGAVAVRDGVIDGPNKTHFERYWVLNVSGERKTTR